MRNKRGLMEVKLPHERRRWSVGLSLIKVKVTLPTLLSGHLFLSDP